MIILHHFRFVKDNFKKIFFFEKNYQNRKEAALCIFIISILTGQLYVTIIQILQMSWNR